jgi:hypothetical protein
VKCLMLLTQALHLGEIAGMFLRSLTRHLVSWVSAELHDVECSHVFK